MLFIKNIQVAKLFGVSPTSVNRWIKQANVKKNNLQLGENQGKQMIIDSEHNRLILHQLSKGGGKYLTGRVQKQIVPKKEFYHKFSLEQIIEIVNSLEIESCLPYKFGFLGEGAKIWDIFHSIETISGVYYTPEGHLLKINLPNVFNFLSTNKFNYIEIGPGNGSTTMDFVKGLINSGKMLTYTAIDISQDMLEILKERLENEMELKNLEKRYIVGDIENLDVRKILYELKGGASQEPVANIISIIGGTVGLINLTKTLSNLKVAMGKEDMLILENAIDNPARRAAFDHITKTIIKQSLLSLPRYLGIDVDLCEIYGEYDDKQQARIIKLKLDKNYNLSVNIGKNVKNLRLVKGNNITICKLTATKVDEISSYLRRQGFEITHFTTDTNYKSTYADTLVMFVRRDNQM